jgi:predicted nucleotidyltransferase component of viral defense system
MDLLEAMPGGLEVAVRDFSLLTLAGQLAITFPGQLAFKGGFVLRHAHGVYRISKDVDTTRHAPAMHKLDSDEVADAIRNASIHDVVRFQPKAPARNTAQSLDFDQIKVIGTAFPDSKVQVEVSYREELVDTPVRATIGAPFYHPFIILTLTKEEMAAEKLRALAQRLRPTDLADLAWLLSETQDNDGHIAEIAVVKFEVVKGGAANKLPRIESRLAEMAETYDTVVPPLFPGAHSYKEAMAIVGPRLKKLVP